MYNPLLIYSSKRLTWGLEDCGNLSAKGNSTTASFAACTISFSVFLLVSCVVVVLWLFIVDEPKCAAITVCNKQIAKINISIKPQQLTAGIINFVFLTEALSSDSVINGDEEDTNDETKTVVSKEYSGGI